MKKGSNKYRFFYHYFKQKDAMSVHFKKQCMVVDSVVCHVPCETKRNRTQPKLVMQGWANSVVVEEGVAHIK
jgi:hypothetical protein